MQFETFVRVLAERELCPNLRPMSGPVGGGDSKVDTETIPVAAEIAISWYQGHDAAEKRWAFAISAKEDWRPKCKDDVDKIVDTDRGYDQIFFITNQNAKDKARAALEDELSKKHDLRVCILDRNWIVERVINGDHIELAVGTLEIDGLTPLLRRELGPLDAKRSAELRILDEQISDPARYIGASHVRAEDCLYAAVLASELERDRMEVDGRFEAALRLAEEAKNDHQRLRVLYRKAWVACFTFDDPKTLSKIYGDIESQALESTQFDAVQRLYRLWCVLFGASQHDENLKKEWRVNDRLMRLTTRLNDTAADESRPNAALEARATLALLELQRCTDEVEIQKVLSNLQSVLHAADGYAEFPFMHYSEILHRLGSYLDVPGYDDLLDSLLELQEKRISEGDKATSLTRRAIQKCSKNRPYDAIRLLGRARHQLLKEEFSEVYERCLSATSGAYRMMGLLWACRACALEMLSLAFRRFEKNGVMPISGYRAAIDLVWVELCLGRVPQLLSSLRNLAFAHAHLDPDARDKDFDDLWSTLDATCAALILRLGEHQLRDMPWLPGAFEHCRFPISEGATLFAMGHYDVLRQGYWFDSDVTDGEIDKSFDRVAQQPSGPELAMRPTSSGDTTLCLRSRVLGFHLSFEVDADLAGLRLAESMLSAMEGFFATSLEGKVVPLISHPLVRFQADEGTDTFDFEVPADFRIAMTVKYHPTMASDPRPNLASIQQASIKMIITLMKEISHVPGASQDFIKMIEDENIFDRSARLTASMLYAESVFGTPSEIEADFVASDFGFHKMEYVRTTPWEPAETAIDREKSPESPRTGSGPIPARFASQENFRHSDRSVLSLINVPVWNSAKWRGLAYAMYPDHIPPELILLFSDEVAATQLFMQWQDELGESDQDSRLRVVLVRGTNMKDPREYRVVISTNVIGLQEPNTLSIIPARIQTASESSENMLQQFLDAVGSSKSYRLRGAVLDEESASPRFIEAPSIGLRELVVREAWTIGEHDLDGVVFQEGDLPVIPDGVEDVPAHRALARKFG